MGEYSPEVIKALEGMKETTVQWAPSVSRIEQAVINLIVLKARHKKKGTVMGEESWLELITHMDEESGELLEAVDSLSVDLSTERKKAHILEELGDIYGLLVHATIKAGFSMDQVEQRELAKLKERFEYDDTVIQHRKADHVTIESSASSAPASKERLEYNERMEPKEFERLLNNQPLPQSGDTYPGSPASPQEDKPEPGKGGCR